MINNPFITRALEPERPDWRDSALCAQVDPDLFFPEKGGRTVDAKRICRRCPVQAECLTEALRDGHRYGIWGARSERELRGMRDPHPGRKRVDRAEIVRLRARGWQMEQIARELHCSPGTVSQVLKAAAS